MMPTVTPPAGMPSAVGLAVVPALRIGRRRANPDSDRRQTHAQCNCRHRGHLFCAHVLAPLSDPAQCAPSPLNLKRAWKTD